MNEIHRRVFKIWGLINFNTKTLSLWLFYENSKSVTLFPRSLRGGDGADKNFRPISTIMAYMNKIHQRVFKIWGLINFNAKTLTLWRKDERTNKRTYERTNVRTNVRTYVRMNERKSENYIPPHTSYVGGIIITKKSFRNTISVKQFRSRSGPMFFFGPDLGPNCLQRLSADNKSPHYLERVKSYNKIWVQMYGGVFDD